MDELLELVRDSNFDEFESVGSAKGYTGSRAERLLEHTRKTKRMCWSIWHTGWITLTRGD